MAERAADSFNRTASELLAMVKRKLPTDRGVQGAINGLEMGKTYNHELPATEFFYSLNENMIKALREDNIDYFYNPEVLATIHVIHNCLDHLRVKVLPFLW